MASLDRLLAVIEAHGADPKRWPAAERSGLEDLARSPQAADALVEARALDAVLAKSPMPVAMELEPLKARILAGADRADKPAHRPVVSGSVTTLSDRRKVMPAPRLRAAWPAAAALAASLLVGAFFGASELGQPAVESLMASAGYDATDELTLDPLGVGDEELL